MKAFYTTFLAEITSRNSDKAVIRDSASSYKFAVVAFGDILLRPK